MITGLALLAAASLQGAHQGSNLQLEILSSGLFDKIHGYAPFGLKLSETKPATITKTPETTNPKYGTITLGGREFTLLSDGGAKLYIDANANGDLTDDPAVSWEEKTFNNGKKGWQGLAKIELIYKGKAVPSAIGLYSVDRPDELGYYADFALAGKANLNGKSYDVIYADPTGKWDGKSGTFLVDKNADGKFNPNFEFYRVSEPLNIEGTTYEFSGLNLVKSTKTVPERTAATPPPDPNLANGLVKGKKALAFKAKTLSGKAVSFPESYKGKVVLVDFWATWCGPCMAEVPNVVKAYNAYYAKGFEVLGVSLDKENAADRVKEVTAKQGMPWEQIYDGKYFDAAIAKQYGIQAIPAVYLVDGDTGVILAAGSEARGKNLDAAIAKALAAKS